MSRIWRRSIVAVMIFVSGAFAQTRPAFEVASVKPVAPEVLDDPNFSAGMQVAGQQVTIRLPLKALIEQAYGVMADHIEGPEWLLTARHIEDLHFFDITAKLAGGSTEAQVPSMLQALLEDRFKLVAHKTSKLAATYALVVGKDGPKLKPKQAMQGDSPAPAISANLKSTQIGDARLTNGPEGTYIIEASSMGGLSYIISALLSETPVIDKTGLQGKYDIKFTLQAIGEWKDQFVENLAKLGLRLEPQKNPVETLVIEHLEKTPTEN